MHSILVKDYMDPSTYAISVESSVRQVVQQLSKQKITGAPIVDAAGALVGYVSEQDCLSEMLNDSFYCDESPAISAVMTKEVKSVSPETSILELAQTMACTAPRNYPVIHEGKLVGMITRSRILDALLEINEDCYLGSR